MLCLVAIFFGAEFKYVNSHTNDTYDLLTGHDHDGTGMVLMIDGKTVLETALEKIGVDTLQCRRAGCTKTLKRSRRAAAKSSTT